MRPTVRRFLAAMLLGAVTTTAVAWWCGWRSNPRLATWRNGTSLIESSGVPPSPDSGIPAGSPFLLFAETVSGPGVQRLRALSIWSITGGRPDQEASDVWPWWVPVSTGQLINEAQSGETIQRDFFAQGWPLPALRCDIHGHDTIEGGLLLSRKPVPGSFLMIEHVLAFRPIWSGFAVDAAIYCIIWFALLFTPGAIVRARRRRGGRCVACGYDLRAAADGRCPECGAQRI